MSDEEKTVEEKQLWKELSDAMNLSPFHDVLKTQHSVPQANLGERGVPSFAGSFTLNRGKMLPKF